MPKIFKLIFIVLLWAFCSVVFAAKNPYPEFNKYIQAYTYDQIYCKSDFTPESITLIKHYFKYATSLCDNDLDKLTIDPKMHEAYQYYLKKAKQGNGKASYLVGWASLMNLGINQQNNPTACIKWFKKSADLGYAPGIATYADSYKAGSIDSITALKKAEKVRYKLYLQAAKKGSRLGYVYLITHYVYKKNSEQTLYWLRKGEALNYPEVILLHAGYSYSGTIVPKDYAKALQLYKKGLQFKTLGFKSIKGTLDAVGDIYYLGTGAKKDYKKAYYYYNQAALLNDGYAQNKLGDMYYAGIGVKKDHKQANYWYCQAQKNFYKPNRLCQKSS